ncbi:MAG: hypothetical protein NC489_08940 [Ruminococcus flavefaciens]|nr:hypothetical protein [Ruminococcus flavefaciens]
MSDSTYPSAIGSILDKPAFLIAVDGTIELVNKNTPDDDTRLAELMVQLTALCLQQAKLVVNSAHGPTDPNITMEDRFYYIVHEADSRWDMVRQYLQDIRHLEVHPLAMISIIRSATVQSTENQTELDHVVITALDRYAESMEDEIRRIMGWTEDDEVKEVKLPSMKNDPELLMEFFQTFKQLGVIHRKRSDYATDEQRQAYDKLMAIFNAIQE